MLNRVIEIASENKFLSHSRGFILIQEKDEIVGKVPLDDISVLIISAQGVTLTKNILVTLSDKGCVTILCNEKYIPSSIILPYQSHYLFTKIMKTQIEASEPLKKQIWKQIIIKKITNQGLNLLFCNKEKEAKEILNISYSVKSGDTDNREAYAAKLYLKYLFGKDFIRDRNAKGINALLNYGYTVLRAAMARSVVAAGLSPSLGVYHDNNLNQFCLVDDLFEIYRPIVDRLVYELVTNKETELSPNNKQYLISSLKIKMMTNEGQSQVIKSMNYLSQSYVKCLETKKSDIELPDWSINENGITLIE